jgi:hypothetical protein
MKRFALILACVSGALAGCDAREDTASAVKATADGGWRARNRSL